MSHPLKYDVIYILDPTASSEEAAAVAAKVEQITADAKGTVLKKDDWGKRRLAYVVKKHREGHYIFFHLQIPAQTVAEITRNLRLMEKVIKFSIVRDEISHLKPRPKPVRNIIPRAEGSTSGHGHSRSSGPSSSAPKPPEAAPAPAAPALASAPADNAPAS